MHAQLEEYRSRFRSIKEEATALVADVDADTLQKRPAPETWSVAQIFDHLNTAGWLLLNPLEQAIQTGQEKGPYGEPPFQYGFISRWFVRSMRPRSGWTFTSPSAFEPASSETLYARETMEDFRSLQDQFGQCVADADGLDLRRIRVSSPAVPLLRISLGAWFEATIAHEERHLQQAERVLERL